MDFVLATIALAQATEAGASGKLVSTSPVAAENYRFVQRYGSRILRSRAQPRGAPARLEEENSPPDTATAIEGDMVTDVDVRHEAEMRELDSAASSRRAKTDSQTVEGNRRPTTPEPARDTVRDSLPAR